MNIKYIISTFFDKKVMLIAFIAAIIYEIIVFIREVKREKDIYNGVDVKEATNYYKKFYHKKEEKEKYNIKAGRKKE